MQTINNWEVISDKPIRKYGRYYIRVKCTCGSEIEKDIPKHHLESQLSRGCDNCSRFHTSKGYELLSGEYWSLVKSGADKRGLDFSITIEQAWSKLVDQGFKCALSGIDIELEPNCVHKIGIDNRRKRTASIDRIDSSLGYTLDNIQWVHKDVNKMKNAFPQDYFIEMCKRISGEIESKSKEVTFL